MTRIIIVGDGFVGVKCARTLRKAAGGAEQRGWTSDRDRSIGENTALADGTIEDRTLSFLMCRGNLAQAMTNYKMSKMGASIEQVVISCG